MSAASPLHLKGAPNFRDLGGYKTASNRTVKHGMVYRSGDSTTLTGDDLATVSRLGPRLIVDLRSTTENQANPARWPLGAKTELIAANILADMRSGDKDILALLLQNPNAQGARDMMLLTYRELPAACGPIISSMFKRMANGDVPLIFHCTYGRDRTGFFAAMLLHALGVPRETIIDDYLKSAEYMDMETANAFTRDTLRTNFNMELDDEGINVLGPPHLEHIEAALASVDQQHGSPDNYLRSFGLDEDVKTSLQQRLLR